MGRILYLGDIHCRLNDLGSVTQSTDAKQDSVIVQVGDFGFGFPGNEMLKWLEKRARKDYKTPIYTAFGNHDNWDLAYQLWEDQGQPDLVELFPESNCYYVHRSSLIEIFGISHLFLGGAESTDKHLRVEGRDWWSREEPNRDEFEKFFSIFDSEKPNTIVTHDVPLRVDLYRMRRNESFTPGMLEKVYSLSSHRPRRHYFGHHHMLKKWKVDGTKFYGCGLHGEYWEREIDNE